MVFLVVASTLAGCGGRGDPAAEPPRAGAPESFERLAERYWQAYLDQHPLRASATGEHRFDARLGDPLSLPALAAGLALERRSLAELGELRPPAAGSEARLDYDLFKRQRELAIEGYTYPEELFPVNPFDGMLQEFALMGAGLGAQPFATSQDFDNWAGRAEGFVVWSRQAIDNLRDGMRRGYLPPRVLVVETLGELQALGTDRPENPFYRPLERLPAALDTVGRERLQRSFTAMVKDKILPAYRRLGEFLSTEYLPLTRDVGGLGRLPLGDAWYAHLVRVQTGTQMTPAEARTLAAAHLERVKARMHAVLAEAGFNGEPAAYLAELRQDPRFAVAASADLLNAVTELQGKIAPLQALVLTVPVEAPLAVRAAPRFRGAFTPLAQYRAASADPGAEALLLVDDTAFAMDGAPARGHATFDLVPLYLEAGVPGRHVQASVQHGERERPRFRRYAVEPAIADGWALYAVSLGEELGLYAEPAPRFAALVVEASAAAAAVVDVGLNADGWTRTQALGYLAAQTPLDPTAAAAIVDRALALPARALAPEVGAEGLRTLRATAAARLGPRFDLRLFHAEILGAGALPLELLRPHIARWIDVAASAPESPADAASTAAAASPVPAASAVPAQIR